ncbi:MAG: Do family serine endopeptidase [Hyphomicrobiaceae bacterium]
MVANSRWIAGHRGTGGMAPVLTLALALGGMLAGEVRARGPESVAPIAERLIDAVVNISTTQGGKGAQSGALPPVPKGAPFEEHFEEFFSRNKGGQPQVERKHSIGSGFVIDGTEGLIVTNHHVIEGADDISVTFSDGSKLKVEKILGKDSKTDLALLKVTPKKPLSFVKFGSANALKVGDWVMAIGNPFGFGGSVTVGIISAKQRNIESGPYDDYLQTDAAINRGNSGGPLFNMAGEVVGINTAILSQTGVSIGIGFAVPSETAMAVLDQLKHFGATRRGWLGVRIQSVAETVADSWGVKANTGAMISSVMPDGPAAKAAIEAGDVILKFDGREVTATRGLPRLVAQTPVGKTVEVELIRKGERKTVNVVVGLLKEDVDAGTPAAGQDRAPSRALVGLKLAPLTDELRQKHGLNDKVKGVVVTEIDPQSPVARNRIKVGDVIVQAGDDEVTTPEDIVKGIDKIRKTGRKLVRLHLEDAKGEKKIVALPIE